jgi:segregation and condensation protein B
MAEHQLNATEEARVETAESGAAAQQPSVLALPSTLKALIEALIFAAKEPLTVKQIQSMYEGEESDGKDRRIDQAEIVSIVEELNKEYEAAQRPYRILTLAGGYQFATLPDYAEWLGRLYKEQARRKLSQSSVETLAIVAYCQPIPKPEIEAIRGVNCDYVLKTLLEKELVTIVGRAPTPGRPLLYGTTKEFLKHFGLNDVSDLPRPREIEEILGESQFEAERRMLEAPQGLLEAKKEEEDFKSRLPHIPKRKPELDETVKIVPKRKRRELKIRAEEKQEQATLPFGSSEPPQSNVAGEVVPPQTISSPPAVEDQIDILSVEEKDGEISPDQLSTGMQETEEQRLVEALPPASEELTQPSDVAVEEGEQVSERGEKEEVGESLMDDKTSTQAIVEGASRTAGAAEEGGAHPKSKWQTWKEKIQGFIKKLFG